MTSNRSSAPRSSILSPSSNHSKHPSSSFGPCSLATGTSPSLASPGCISFLSSIPGFEIQQRCTYFYLACTSTCACLPSSDLHLRPTITAIASIGALSVYSSPASSGVTRVYLSSTPLTIFSSRFNQRGLLPSFGSDSDSGTSLDILVYLLFNLL